MNERESGNLILPEAEVDRLQNSLLAEIHKSKRQIEDSSDFKNYPLVTIFTARNRLETSGFVNPSGIVTNPDIFFIGDFSCLFFKEQPITPNLFKFLGIPYSLQMLSRDKSAHTTSRVIVIEEYLYNDISKLSIKYSVNTFFDIQIQKIAQHRGVGVLTAEYLLKKTAMRYFIQNGMKDYTTCVMDAAQFLCF